MLYVLVMVCLLGQPCDVDHARAYQACRAPPGILLYGLPGSIPLANAAWTPMEGEEQHIRCRIGDP